MTNEEYVERAYYAANKSYHGFCAQVNVTLNMGGAHQCGFADAVKYVRKNPPPETQDLIAAVKKFLSSDIGPTPASDRLLGALNAFEATVAARAD